MKEKGPDLFLLTGLYHFISGSSVPIFLATVLDSVINWDKGNQTSCFRAPGDCLLWSEWNSSPGALHNWLDTLDRFLPCSGVWGLEAWLKLLADPTRESMCLEHAVPSRVASSLSIILILHRWCICRLIEGTAWGQEPTALRISCLALYPCSAKPVSSSGAALLPREIVLSVG